MIFGVLVSYATAASYGLQFLFPRRERRTPQRVYITSRTHLEEEGAKKFRDLRGHDVVLVQTAGGLRAISTTCTHLGCHVYWEPEHNRFFCPCHNAVFDVDGNVVVGPPPRPLQQYAVEEDEGSIFVMLDA